MSTAGREHAASVLAQFAVPGTLLGLELHRGGLINDSWLATLGAVAASRERTTAATGGWSRYLLQHINRHVFRRPSEVMDNMVRVTRHLAGRLVREGAPDARRRCLELVPTRSGDSHHVDAEGETWRLVRWIEGTRSAARARTAEEAFATAFAFGGFLRQLADLPGPRLHETIPGFHDTPSRLLSFERVLASDPAGRAVGCRPEIEALLARAPLARALAARVEDGTLLERPVHNDAKIANVLFDQTSGEVLCVVDLDTVMPGLALHDFGDLARTAVSDSEEDERELSRVEVRLPFFEALVRGFVEGAGDALSPAERALLVTGALTITYEQALRFLADHLDGDRYYKIERPGHNLERARTQIALVASMERQRDVLERLR